MDYSDIPDIELPPAPKTLEEFKRPILIKKKETSSLYNEIQETINKMKLEIRKPIREKVFYCTLNFYYHYMIDHYKGQLCYITDKHYLIRNGVIQ